MDDTLNQSGGNLDNPDQGLDAGVNADIDQPTGSAARTEAQDETADTAAETEKKKVDVMDQAKLHEYLLGLGLHLTGQVMGEIHERFDLPLRKIIDNIGLGTTETMLNAGMTELIQRLYPAMILEKNKSKRTTLLTELENEMKIISEGFKNSVVKVSRLQGMSPEGIALIQENQLAILQILRSKDEAFKKATVWALSDRTDDPNSDRYLAILAQRTDIYEPGIVVIGTLLGEEFRNQLIVKRATLAGAQAAKDLANKIDSKLISNVEIIEKIAKQMMMKSGPGRNPMLDGTNLKNLGEFLITALPLTIAGANLFTIAASNFVRHDSKLAAIWGTLTESLQSGWVIGGLAGYIAVDEFIKDKDLTPEHKKEIQGVMIGNIHLQNRRSFNHQYAIHLGTEMKNANISANDPILGHGKYLQSKLQEAQAAGDGNKIDQYHSLIAQHNDLTRDMDPVMFFDLAMALKAHKVYDAEEKFTDESASYKASQKVFESLIKIK